MLIDFRVKNFRSIRDEVTLSMVANRSPDLRDTNVRDPNAAGVPELVLSAAIFGPNGAGKTSLIQAIQFMRSFVSSSATSLKPGEQIPVMPFFLDLHSHEKPSEFEVTFVEEGVKYQYGFAVDTTRVIEEWLYAAPEGRTQTWLERSYEQKTGQYSWRIGPYIKGQKRSIQASTRSNGLFLSTAAQLNNPQLQTVWTWFSDKLRAFHGRRAIDEGYTNRICAEDDQYRKRILAFLRDAAISVDSIKVRETKPKGDSPLAANSHVELRSDESTKKELEPWFSHVVHGTSETVDFPLAMESAGTQFVYAWAGPLIDVLERGLVLVLDELDSSLHPHLSQYLISLFHDPKKNRKGAQLVFTSHSTPIMGNRDLLRRDQVWFVYKDRNDGTRLAAFIDFKPRKGEDRERNYLGGRYGAIPQLPDLRKH